MQENEKLEFKLSAWVINVILPTRSSPSLLGDFTRLSFNQYPEALDEMNQIPGVLFIKPDTYKTHRELQVVCDSQNEPYFYMEAIQRISRKYGFYPEHTLEKKHA